MIKNAPRKSKFRNIKTIIDGTEFASKLEAGRYAQLKLMERAGLIGDLETQRSFDLTVNGIVVTRYIADFVYVAAGSLELVEMCIRDRCKDCHQGSRNGIHGMRIMWNLMKKTELACLSDTLQALYGSIK